MNSTPAPNDHDVAANLARLEEALTRIAQARARAPSARIADMPVTDTSGVDRAVSAMMADRLDEIIARLRAAIGPTAGDNAP